MDATQEQWRPVIGFEGLYEVSDQGRVRSLGQFARGSHGSQRFVRGRVLRPAPSKTGHLTVALGRGGGTKLVHALVAEAFIGPRPAGMDVCHGNGVPSDNRVDNLRYGTRSENHFDRVAHGNHYQANKTHCIHGHEFTPENTYVQRGNNRGCRACKNKSERQRYYRKRAASLKSMGST
ncbi:NUMOD4 motif-containing HNH endonuclease [Mycolicibacterium peregrinum]